jgi:hypothetical protein
LASLALAVVVLAAGFLAGFLAAVLAAAVGCSGLGCSGLGCRLLRRGRPCRGRGSRLGCRLRLRLRGGGSFHRHLLGLLGTEVAPPGGHDVFELVTQLVDLRLDLIEVHLGGQVVERLGVGDLAEELLALARPDVDPTLEVRGPRGGVLAHLRDDLLDHRLGRLRDGHLGADCGVEILLCAHGASSCLHS